MKGTFEFDPDKWLGNRALRGCSTGARGLWVDLLSLMHPEGGYLTIKGQPIDDAKLARLIGEPIKFIRAWIKELGEAGIFDVSEDGRMFSSRMVKKASFVANAKKHGERGQRNKRASSEQHESGNPEGPSVSIGGIDLNGDGSMTVSRLKKRPPTSPPPEYRMEEPNDRRAPRAKKSAVKNPASPAKKASAAPWWKSPAGWVRYGAGQAMSMKSDEAFEDFQCRVAARIPPGRHMDELTAGQLRMVESLRPKDPSAKQE